MQDYKARVLVVDDEENQRRGLSSLISGWGYEVQTAENGAHALEVLESWPAQLIVTDMMMPVLDGAGLLERLREQSNPPLSIVVTAFGNLETALNTIHQLGAFWFLEKPIDPQALKLLLDRALGARRLSEDKQILERQLGIEGRLAGLVGQTDVMLELFGMVQQVAPTKASVLITGESGTGKEVLARAIHQLSARAKEPFVALNCAALPESLIESELFGHEKGAFTGAIERRAGCFELAHRGTLLLDEIGEMPVSTQSKLLRVLEDGRVRRLGAKSEIEVDVRIVAATNLKLEESIAKGGFREDLFYRLNVVPITVPALRERREDIEQLVVYFLQQFAARDGLPARGITDEALVRLSELDWPGNVRELRNTVERLVILASASTIAAPDVERLVGKRLGEPAGLGNLVDCTTFEEFKVAAERAFLLAKLRGFDWNVSETARALDMPRSNLYKKIERYALTRESTPA